jgi:hypothetical protein
MNVEGIGKNIASKIIEIFNLEYNEWNIYQIFLSYFFIQW